MPSFKTTKRMGFPKSATKKSQENRYWDTFKPTFTKKHTGIVADLAFSPTAPHDLYVANSIRVTVHSVLNFETERAAVSNRDEVKVIRCRGDGKLLIVGGATKVVQVISTSSSLSLRRFYKGHTATVYVADFHYSHYDTFLTAGDDKNLIEWDLISGRIVRQYRASDEFIRAGTWHGKSLYATGSYDKVVRFWDLRAPEKTPTHSFEVDDNVESLHFIPNTDLLVAAAGKSLFLHSLRADKVLRTLKNHRKTILKVTSSVEGGRLFSAGADRLIKIYETQDFKLTHQKELEQPISALAVSPSGNDFAVGHVNGEMSIFRRKGTEGYKPAEKDSTLDKYLVSLEEQKSNIKMGTPKWFYRGTKNKPEVYDLVIRPYKKKKYSKFDEQLRKFNHHAALDAAFEVGNMTVVASALNELWKRNGLEKALKDRSPDSLAKVMKFVSHFVSHPHISKLAIHVGGVLLKLYGKDISREPRLHELFEDLRVYLAREITLVKNLTKLLGTASLVLSLPSENSSRKESFINT